MVDDNPCIRNPARPGKTGVKAWPESRGEPGHQPGFGQAGQGIKKPGKPGPQGQPGLARPGKPGSRLGLKARLWPDWPRDISMLIKKFNMCLIYNLFLTLP